MKTTPKPIISGPGHPAELHPPESVAHHTILYVFSYRGETERWEAAKHSSGEDMLDALQAIWEQLPGHPWRELEDKSREVSRKGRMEWELPPTGQDLMKRLTAVVHRWGGSPVSARLYRAIVASHEQDDVWACASGHGYWNF